MGFGRGNSNASTIVSLVKYVLVFTKKSMSTLLVGLLIILINGFFPACTICLLLRNSNAVEDHNRTIYVFLIIKVLFCFHNYLLSDVKAGKMVPDSL